MTRQLNDTEIRSIQRLRAKGKAVSDIADRHSITGADVLSVPCGNEYQDSASEAAIQSACVEYLTLRGWFVIETSQRWAADPRLAGLPDVLAWRAGVTMTLEMKTRKGKLRPSQVRFAEGIAPHVADTLVYAVIRSPDELIVLEGRVLSR